MKNLETYLKQFTKSQRTRLEKTLTGLIRTPGDNVIKRHCFIEQLAESHELCELKGTSKKARWYSKEDPSRFFENLTKIEAEYAKYLGIYVRGTEVNWYAVSSNYPYSWGVIRPISASELEFLDVHKASEKFPQLDRNLLTCGIIAFDKALSLGDMSRYELTLLNV